MLLLTLGLLQIGGGFWQFNIGNLILLISIVGQAVVFLVHSSHQHGENQEKIAAIIEWKRQHEDDAKKRDDAISELRIIAGAMKATADGVSEAVKLMQSELRDIRNEKRKRERES